MFEHIEIGDAVGIDCLDGYQLLTQRPLKGVRYPPRGGEIAVRYSKAAVRDPVTLGQKATSRGSLLESTQTSTAKLLVIQR